MSKHLIINLRHQLPWHQRYLSTTTTALLWMGWLGLWKPLLAVALGFMAIHQPHLLLRMLGGIGIEHYLVMLSACAISLWLWSSYMPAKRIKHFHRYRSQDYANYYQLNQELLIKAQGTKNLTVIHHPNGQIADLKSNPAVEDREKV